MSTENSRNDKIHKICGELGYCCPYAFFKINCRKTDTNKRLAMKLQLSLTTIEFNKRKLKSGEMICLHLPTCKVKDLPT